MEEVLISKDWLEDKGFQKNQIGSYQYWQRINEEGLYLDYLVFRINDIACFGILGLDMGSHFKSIMGKEKKIFYTWEIVEIYKLLIGEDIGL